MDKPQKPHQLHCNETTDTKGTPQKDGVQSRDEQHSTQSQKPIETGGPSGLEPTRYGDWERKGRCIDF